MSKYIKYEVEDFAADDAFIKWCIAADDSETYWSEVLNTFPQKAKTIYEAKLKILNLKIMKNYYLFLLLSFLSISSITANPVLLFSDIESGPKSGWSSSEPNKGAAVSIWGNGFGSTRGTSFVTVNGTNITSSADYAVWGEYWPTQYLQRITFWLNSSISDGEGTITVTVNGVTSNTIPFTIRAGNIYFITKTNPGGNGSISSPFAISNNTSQWINNAVPGNIYYFRDASVYNTQANGGNSIIWIRSSEVSGTAALPIALLAFPAEKPLFSVPTYNINFYNGIRFSNNYMVFSGFSFDTEYQSVSLEGDFHRFIGNDVVGVKNKYQSGTGIVNTGNINTHTGDGSVILGNAIHGGNSKDRFDHALYVSGCSDNTGIKIGWNHLYDNDFARGPIIVINHQENRCGVGQVVDAHFVFNNIVDCSVQRSKAIGVFDLSFDAGEPEPEPSYVYNNVLINCGAYDGTNTSQLGWMPAIEQDAVGKVRFYNNTLYNTGYIGFSTSANVTETHIKNNIIHMNPNFPGPTGNHYTSFGNPPAVSLSNNLYYGIGNNPPCTTCALDQNHVNNQDPLFVDPINFDLRLQSGSPAINAGTNNLLFEVSPPSYAPINRDIDFVLRSGSTPSIGAYELCNIVTNTNNDGVGSLRFAIDCVMDGDTIFFSNALDNAIIVINALPLTITKSITILNENLNKVTIRHNADDLFIIQANRTVWLQNMHLQTSVAEKNCIENSGILTLNNVNTSATNSNSSNVKNMGAGTLSVLGSNTFR